MDLTFSKSFGKAQQLNGISLSTFIASVSTSCAVFLLQLIALLVLRIWLPNLYLSKHKPLNFNLRALLRFEVCCENHEPCCRHPRPCSRHLDIFFFHRYLRTLFVIFAPTALVMTPILVPLNAVKGKNATNGVRGLDVLGWSNISLRHTDRYWAHLILGLCFIGYLGWVIWREMAFYVSIRQRSQYAVLRFVLVESIPTTCLNEASIREKLGHLAQGIKTITFNRDYRQLDVLDQKRQDLLHALEAARTPFVCGAKHPGKDESIVLKIAQLSDQIRRLRESPESFRMVPSAVIEYTEALRANIACQMAIHPESGYMTPRSLPLSPEDIVWDNVCLGWWERTMRTILSNLVISILATICVIPVAFAGLLSQIIYLTKAITWLSWINDLPGWSLGVIQGILPPTILAILLAIYSLSLQYLVQLQGISLKSQIRLKIQDYYFYFLFTQVTLVITLSAGLTSIVNEVSAGGSLPLTLAKNLPKASNYFLSYVLLQGLSVSANALLQLRKLVNTVLIGPILDHTVTAMVEREKGTELQWGTFIPVYSNLACIGIIYSVISPIIIPLQVAIFGLFWVAYSNVTMATPEDNGGMFYPKAIRHLLVGIYAMELGLAILFILVRDASGRVSCIGQTCIMVIAVLLTMVFHHLLRKTFDPLLSFSPVSFDIAQLDTDSPFVPIALTSTPIIRLPRDRNGVSDAEKDRFRDYGIEVKDDEAMVIDGTIRLNYDG